VPILLAIVAFAPYNRADDEISDVAVKVKVPILLAIVAFAPYNRVEDEISDVAVKVNVLIAPLTSNNTLGAVVPIPTFPFERIRILSTSLVENARLLGEARYIPEPTSERNAYVGLLLVPLKL
jgi:hypothetical protein